MTAAHLLSWYSRRRKHTWMAQACFLHIRSHSVFFGVMLVISIVTLCSLSSRGSIVILRNLQKPETKHC